ncbi:hypothetical protein BJX66DRAFT_224214 [Aspergillus keveii]|uniref:Uncharacterized protein n=1 Tax=Aspergillus keveii TaxID=714993 RepID=A0ABR4G371_9EURO
MRFTTVIFTLLTSSLLALAAPAENVQALNARSEGFQPEVANVRVERDFDDDDVDFVSAERTDNARPACPPNSTCGMCNGTSCRINGVNLSCGRGKCTVQSGGGDGTPCWALNGGGGIVCPGRGNGNP